MNWSLIPMPAAEELAGGFVPPVAFDEATRKTQDDPELREMRRYLVALFVALGMIACVESAIIDHPADGQRRLAEVNLSERKAECRDCAFAFDHSPEMEN
ncbi:hypothetical protein NAP1_08787 [Erythrobacter sp. NAP1]|uniref:hypothetical protein n=1 Tax=Erythrobacter sp. NAP1 TaxID=237727 RepID=UPI000068514A|nr:hypothetical protein [Erythrobacter sp. NAP1]EAQ27676.1 hypothetical protein NAP1_08787 [Erythrobacter sp. NAP1]